jgi:hypothetical protein
MMIHHPQGRIAGTPDVISTESISSVALQGALSELDKTPWEKQSTELKLLVEAATVILTLREKVLERDWALVAESAIAGMESLERMPAEVGELVTHEMRLARCHAEYVRARKAILDALGGGGMRGGVGQTDSRFIETRPLENALQAARALQVITVFWCFGGYAYRSVVRG